MTLRTVIAADFATIATDTGAFGESVTVTAAAGTPSVTVYGVVGPLQAELVETANGQEMVNQIVIDVPRATVSAALSRDVAGEDTITFDSDVYGVQRTSPHLGVVRCYCLLLERKASATDGQRLARPS